MIIINFYRLILMNKTTIEFKEKSFDNNSYLKYNLGIFKNLQSVLGKNILIWWIPITEDSDLNGYAYDINGEYNFDYFNDLQSSVGGLESAEAAAAILLK